MCCLCRAHFYSSDTSRSRAALAGHASFEGLAALVAVFGLPGAQEIARQTEKPLQVSLTCSQQLTL